MKNHLESQHNIKEEQPESNDDLDDILEKQHNKKVKTTFYNSEEFLLEFIITGALPFRIVENEFFLKFIRSINPSFVMPSRYILTSRILNNTYQKNKEIISYELSQVNAVSITLDCWTSIQNYSYLGVTCHFFTEEFFLNNRTLAINHLPGRNSCENITNALLTIINEWNIQNKILAAVTDNAKNMSNISTNLMDFKAQKIYGFGCAAHIINLIVKKLGKISNSVSLEALNRSIEFQNQYDELDEIEDIVLDERDFGFLNMYKNLVEKCRKISALFHQSVIFPEILIDKQIALNLQQHNLIQDVPTRLNSTFLILERTKEQVDAINETLFDRRLNRKYENLNLDLEEKEMLNEAVFILQPFYDATVELSGFSVALNKVLKHNTIGYMPKYKILENPYLITASYLDIRTKLFVKFSEAKKKEYVNIAKNKIRSIADNFPENLKQNLKLNESHTVTRLTQIDQSVMETNSQNRLQLFDFNKDFEAK